MRLAYTPVANLALLQSKKFHNLESTLPNLRLYSQKIKLLPPQQKKLTLEEIKSRVAQKPWSPDELKSTQKPHIIYQKLTFDDFEDSLVVEQPKLPKQLIKTTYNSGFGQQIHQKFSDQLSQKGTYEKQIDIMTIVKLRVKLALKKQFQKEFNHYQMMLEQQRQQVEENINLRKSKSRNKQFLKK